MTDLRIQFSEAMVGAGHPAKPDTLNRLALVGHNNDGTHKFWFDAKEYGAAGNGTTDDTAAIQAAIDAMTSGGVLYFPAGTYKITGTLYLTSSTNMITYHIRGAGKGTLLKPTGFTSGYLFKLNEDSVGSKVVSWPRHPRLIVEDLAVSGVDSTSVSLLWYNQASFQFKRLILDYLLYGAYGTGYVDLVKMEYIHWGFSRSSGWLYRQGGKGDGFEGNQLFSSGSDIANNMVWLYRGLGASIEKCIGGYYRFEESQVTVRDGHFEESTTPGTETNHMIQVINSNVTLENNNFRVDISTYDSIYVNDTAATAQPSSLVLRNNIFTRNLNNGGSPLGQREMYINALNDNSRIVLFNNKTLVLNADSSDYPTTYEWYPLGIKVRSAIGALDTDLLSYIGLLSANTVIEKIQGNWKIHPVNSFDVPMNALTAPTIDAITQGAKPASNLTNTTYYYRAESVDANYRYSAASAEVSIAQTGTNSIKLEISGLAPNTSVRLMRGTASGTYDRYVDIPAFGGKAVFFDSGSRINQHAWNNSVYTHHTTGITYAGVHNVLTGLKTVYGTAAPGAGSWVVGDRFINTAPAAGGYIGWVCTTAGSPGTWKTFGAVTP